MYNQLSTNEKPLDSCARRTLILLRPLLHRLFVLLSSKILLTRRYEALRLMVRIKTQYGFKDT